MYDLQIHTVRSRAMTGTELVDAMRKFAAQSQKEDFETYTTQEAHACPLLLHELPTLDAFQSVSSTFGITLNAKGTNPKCGEIFELLTRRTYDISLNHTWATWYACESDIALESCKQDISIFAGRRKEGYFSGLDLFHPSPAISSIAYRKALFDKAIATVGVSDKIVTQMGDDVLYMKAGIPWKLVYPSHQVPGGGNPLGFFACGFAGVEEALAAGGRLIQQFATKLLGVSFVAVLTREGYEAVYRELSAHWQPWEIEVIGSLTPEAIDILAGGDISNDSPRRIPAFTWYREKKPTVYGSVVIDNDNRYLEVATDSSTVEQLRESLAFLEDIQFAPLLPGETVSRTDSEFG